MAERSPRGGSEAIDSRRYVAAIRRDLPLIAAITVALTIAAFAVSLVLPKVYSSAAQVGFDLNTTTSGDAVAQERKINTEVELVTTRPVVTAAAQALVEDGITVDPDTLRDSVEAEPVFGKNVLRIVAVADQPDIAAAYANAVADEYAESRNGAQRSGISSQIRDVNAQIERAETSDQKRELESFRQQLLTERATIVDQVQLATPADVPGGPDSPKPVRNAVLAAFVGIFLGVLVALLRDQLRPRFGSARDLAQFLDLPVMARIPELGRRRPQPAGLRVEQEAIQSLSAAVRIALPPGQSHVLLTTSSVHAEGKTSVTSKLARALAASGQRTLLISGDLRWPRLDALLGVDGRPGFSDLLAAQRNGTLTLERLRTAIVHPEGRDRVTGGADVLPSGTMSSDAAQLLSSGAIDPLLDEIRKLGYAYVLIDATPLLGIVDAKLVGRACDAVLVVSRLERITVSGAMDLRDELDRIGQPALGVVVIGGTSDTSPYYTGAKLPSGAEPAPGGGVTVPPPRGSLRN